MKKLEEVEIFLVGSLIDHTLLVDVEQHLLVVVHRVVGELGEADYLNQCGDVQLIVVLLRSIRHQLDLSVPPAATAFEELARDKVQVVRDQEAVRCFEHFAE